MLPTPLVFLDTETTGLSMRNDRIIEIGLIRVENGIAVAKYQTLLNPQTYISPFITTITGIHQSQLENAPEFADIAKTLYEYLEGAILVAHNARFDYGFLRNEFMHIGKKYVSRQICSAKLSRILFPQFAHHNLDSIIKRFHIQVENRHRALDDAKVVWDFFTAIEKKLPQEAIDSAIAYVLKHPSFPIHLQSQEIESLSENPGVYIFYGENDVPLYVGKSVNIKDRVLSHFANDHKESKEMHLSRQVKRIETIPTSGELGALLKESELIKSMQPLYNRRLRASRRIIVLKEFINEQGYKAIQVEELPEIHPDQTKSIVATCPSKKQAKEYLYFLKNEYNLCEKLLGLEKTKSSCFSYKLGTCKGACIGKEDALRYNSRCIIAFSKNKIKPWPFTGAILIQENNAFFQTTDEFWVDKWCLLGKRTSDEFTQGQFKAHDYRFDMDTYKILLRFVKQQADKKTVSIRTVSSENESLSV